MTDVISSPKKCQFCEKIYKSKDSETGNNEPECHTCKNIVYQLKKGISAHRDYEIEIIYRLKRDYDPPKNSFSDDDEDADFVDDEFETVTFPIPPGFKRGHYDDFDNINGYALKFFEKNPDIYKDGEIWCRISYIIAKARLIKKVKSICDILYGFDSTHDSDTE